MSKVLTAPTAIIMVGGVVVGEAKTLNISENFRRGRVTGIGRANPLEVPFLEFSGTVNASFYNIDYSAHPFGHSSILRKTDTSSAFFSTMLLQEVGFDLILTQRKPDLANFPPEGRDPNTQIIQEIPDLVFAKIPNCFITSDGFNLNEGQISERNGTFEFTDGIYFSV
jgi:hypothetical protein